MMNPTDQRIIGIEKAVCCSQIPREVAKPYYGVRVGSHGGSTRVDQETKREEETVGKSFYYGFQGKEWAKQSNEQI